MTGLGLAGRVVFLQAAMVRISSASAKDTRLCLAGGEGESTAVSPVSLLFFRMPALGEAAGGKTQTLMGRKLVDGGGERALVCGAATSSCCCAFVVVVALTGEVLDGGDFFSIPPGAFIIVVAVGVGLAGGDMKAFALIGEGDGEPRLPFNNKRDRCSITSARD